MRKENLKEVRRILIVVDMINGFIREGNMKDEYINHIVPETVRLVELFLRNKDAVAFARDSHKKGCAEFLKFPEHCLEGTSESELIDELKKYEKQALVYLKNSTSIMFAPNFMDDINAMKNLKEVVVTGCCTDICDMNLAIPLQNYFDQHDRDVKIIVPENAVETYDAPWHNREEYRDSAFKFMSQAGIQLVKKYRRDGKYGKQGK